MLDFGARWEVLGKFREGGQGETFKVRDRNPLNGKTYILKRLKNPKRLARFDREIEACLSLEHPNLLKIEEYGDAPGKDGRRYFVTEFCELGNLEDQAITPNSITETIELFRQVCAGVAHAHANGIIHRDLKPENILLKDDGIAMVADFGLCFMVAEEEGSRLTATMEVAGARWYCAPELRDGRLESGISQAPADVYSLGKLLYWMISGRRMFDREDYREEGYRIDQRDPTEPAYEVINRLFEKTIVRDPSARIQNAGELLAEVDRLLPIIKAGGHAIGLEHPHRCLFCARGVYRTVINGLADDSPGLSAANHAASSLLGWRAPDSPNPPAWLVMVCEECGNVQTFRPDLVVSGNSINRYQEVKKKKAPWLEKHRS